MSTYASTPLTPTSKQDLVLQFYGISLKSKNDQIKILENVSGEFHSGRLSAIIGPSGAGKTSLLNILTGFKSSRVKGTIRLNGEKRNKQEFRQICSYIPQDFALLAQLTALETIQFAADLKLDSKYGGLTKSRIVQNIVQLLNLTKCSNVRVSHLSGGERKRLSIATELVTNPPIMFFDEPTSGLDSVSAIQVLQHLHDLAHSGRAIICVIHQPSLRLLKFFDDVYVLSDGQCIYNGPLENMVPTFEQFDFVYPRNYNQADFALEIASKELTSDLSPLVEANHRKFNSIDLTDITATSYNRTPKMQKEDNFSEGAIQVPAKTLRKYPVNCFKQFVILTRRSLLVTFRNFMWVQVRIITHILVGLLLGGVFWGIGKDASTVLSNVCCILFFLVFIFLANSMPAVLSFPLEMPVFLREHFNHWYSIGAYYFAKFISDIPLQFICPTVFLLSGYFLTGQPVDVGRFIMFWVMCSLMSLLAQSMGLVAGAAFNMQLAIFLVPALSIPMLFFAGFFIRFHELLDVLKPLTKISYFRHSFEGALHAIYGYNRTLPCNKIYCYYENTDKLLRDFGMAGERYSDDVLGLIIWIIVLQTLLYVSLVVKVKRYQ